MGYGDKSHEHNAAVRKAIEKGRIEWHMWANTLAVFGACCMILGGILGLAGELGSQGINVFAVAAGLLLFTMEWARGSRKRGRTLPREFQDHITPWLTKFGIVWTNLYVRGLIHLGLALPLFFELQTIIGGACLVMSGIVNVKSAFKGETWTPYIPRERREKKGQMIAAPKTAPPRRPGTEPKSPLVSNESITDPEPPAARKMSNPNFSVAGAPHAAPKPTIRERPKLAPTSAPPSRPLPRPGTRSGGPSRPPPKPSVWEELTDDSSGQKYYFNSETNVTQWDKPLDI